MAKVVLIDSLGWQAGIHNLGLAYVAAGLKLAGHQVEVIDLNNRFRPQSEIVALIRERNPQYIGFSVKSATFANATELHKALLEACPAATYVYGGPHVSLAGRSILEETPPAIFFRGDAEYSLAAFIAKHQRGDTDFQDVQGILYCDRDGQVHMTEVANYTNLDELPLPDFSGFDSLDCFQIYPLLTSRGCPYKCTYCSVPTISGIKWKARGVESVMGEIDHVLHTLHMDTVVIVDDNFTLHKGRAEAICRALKERGYHFTWSCANGIRADRIWPDLAQLMFEAGCHEVAFGIESWDPEILAGLTKGEDHHAIRQGIQIARDAGIKVTGFFMIGLPGSTYRKDLRSLATALRLGLDNFYFGLTVPYPGTELWQWAQKNVRFLIPWQNTYHIAEVFREGLDKIKMEPVFDTPEYPAEERKKMFQMVQTVKAGRAARSLRRIIRQLRVEAGRPVVVIRSSWREHLCALALDMAPENPHVMLWKGAGDPLAQMNPDLRAEYRILQIPGTSYLSAEDATDELREDLSGALVIFDVPGGLLENYQNVLAFARALNPGQVLALLGEEFRLLDLVPLTLPQQIREGHQTDALGLQMGQVAQDLTLEALRHHDQEVGL